MSLTHSITVFHIKGQAGRSRCREQFTTMLTLTAFTTSLLTSSSHFTAVGVAWYSLSVNMFRYGWPWCMIHHYWASVCAWLISWANPYPKKTAVDNGGISLESSKTAGCSTMAAVATLRPLGQLGTRWPASACWTYPQICWWKKAGIHRSFNAHKRRQV